jgi:hypothetical protein
MHRTNTGRLASGFDDTDQDKLSKKGKKEQVQNVPKKLRDAIVPDPGHYFVGGDWRALQWCLCMRRAAILNVPEGYHKDLLARFLRGELDPHSFLASHFDPTPEGRQRAKSYTYGRMFKGTPRGLARDAGHRDAVGLEVCDAHDKAFKLQTWWADTLDFVKRHHYIQTAGGWRRYFWEWQPDPNDVLAALIQGDEGDVLKWCLAQYFSNPEGLLGEMITTTHDSVLFMFPDSLPQEQGKAHVQGILETPVPFHEGQAWPSEVKVGMSWRAVS